MVRIRFYGQARRVAGTDELRLDDVAGLSLKELLLRFGGEAGGPSPGLTSNVLVNGRNCSFLRGLDTQLADGDVVEILPVVGGG